MFQASISYFSVPAQDINTQKADLLIYFGDMLFSYVVLNEGNEIIAFEKYSFDTNHKETLQNFFEAKEWLNDKYKNVKLAYGTKQVTLVPQEFFNSKEIDSKLNIMYGDVGSYISFSEAILNHKAKTIYRVTKDAATQLASKYPNAFKTHFESYAINYIQKKAIDTPTLSIYILEDGYTITLISQQKLFLGKTYHFDSNEHLVYCLLSICKMYNVPVDEVQLLLSGWVSKESALYKEIYKYFVNIGFESLDSLSIANQEYELHYFKPFELIQSL
jgi:Protein of unknown function (DUF3822)